MLIGSTYEQHVFPASPLPFEAGVDVCREHRANKVPEVLDAVNVWQRGCNEYSLFGHAFDLTPVSIASRRLKRGLAFSKEGRDEINAALARLEINLRTAATIFISGDIRAARALAEEKAGFRELEGEASRAHFRRLREGNITSTETSSLHVDLLRDLKRVNAHLIAGAAYPLLQERGELRSTRLKKDAGTT